MNMTHLKELTITFPSKVPITKKLFLICNLQGYIMVYELFNKRFPKGDSS